MATHLNDDMRDLLHKLQEDTRELKEFGLSSHEHFQSYKAFRRVADHTINTNDQADNLDVIKTLENFDKALEKAKQSLDIKELHAYKDAAKSSPTSHKSKLFSADKKPIIPNDKKTPRPK